MDLMDKVKTQVEQAMAKAQHGMSQLDRLPGNKRADVLLRNLGAAYYAKQRTGGPVEAVTEALAKIDDHVAEHGPVDAPPAAPSPAGIPTGVGRRA